MSRVVEMANEIDVTDMTEALCAARRQSVEEFFADMSRFSTEEALAQFVAAGLEVMSLDQVTKELGELPSAEDLFEVGPRVIFELTTEGGMVLYALSCQAVPGAEDICAVVAVHCFDQEEPDFARQSSFILFEYEGRASFLEAELYVQMLEGETATDRVYLLPVYEITRHEPPGIGKA